MVGISTPLVEIGLTDQENLGGPWHPLLRQPFKTYLLLFQTVYFKTKNYSCLTLMLINILARTHLQKSAHEIGTTE